jgi:WhiB family redox-sensing transcriptional regulator
LTPLFFSDVNVDIARAKAICRRCSLAASCLEGALEREEPWGVWGGELIESGRVIADRRPRGRPSVLPKPILVIDEDRTLRTITNVSEQRDRTKWQFASPDRGDSSTRFTGLFLGCGQRLTTPRLHREIPAAVPPNCGRASQVHRTDTHRVAQLASRWCRNAFPRCSSRCSPDWLRSRW